MSRSKREILDTEAMLSRLTILLATENHKSGDRESNPRADAEALRRISMTLRRWHELECGDSNNSGAWAIVRGYKPKRDSMGARLDGGPNDETFIHDDGGAPFIERHHWNMVATPDCVKYYPIADRERGAQKRLAAIMARYPSLTAYIQTDPRGCSLYILKPGDVPAGEDPGSYYSRGLAVFQ